MSNETVFPLTEDQIQYTNEKYQGITVRDYIAIKAMQALITAKPNAAYDFISETAYRNADSMLKARNK